jgi:hypothetical protein
MGSCDHGNEFHKRGGISQPDEALLGCQEFSFVIPFYLQSVPVHSANGVKTYTAASEECSVALLCNEWVQGSREQDLQTVTKTTAITLGI